MSYTEVFLNSFKGYAQYLWHEVLNPHWGNFFYWLIAISVVVYLLELLFPWRKNQPALRQDFWLDSFYMFFNVFIFSLIGYAALSNVMVELFNDFLQGTFGISNLVAIEIGSWPRWAQLLTLFLIRDFVQWNTHVILHKVPFLWRFHQVHHSVEQMGFAAHLRYHFMETFVYRTMEYLPLAMIGFGIQDFIVVHLFALTIGHLNHANIYLPLGPLKYLLNSPQMHIWHHAKELPKGTSGVNYGITLSIWDYLFGTVWMPHDGRDIELGFEGVEKYPHGFFEQVVEPFKKEQ
ncbi:MAG: sterol desaturase family protein [Chitinophagales bacterium]|jgi:sterol desaturase/sphingolipid hydroxylase (fatty acid hydroxylase superfamily)